MSGNLTTLYSSTRMALTIVPSLSMIIFLHSIIVNQRLDIVDKNRRVEDVSVHRIEDVYDFIIVGGGSAGSVMANRLTEVSSWKVLLLEAGPDEDVVSDLPIMFPTLQQTSVDWRFQTEPNDRYCLAMKGGRCNWPRGKVLGGSSVLNAMLYVRGNRRDYDDWADLGNAGWSYDDVLPYFKKSEGMRIEELMDDPYHGKDGPLSVENFRFHSILADWFLKAGEELGYETVDVNGKYQTGFTLSQGTLHEGLRCSTAKAYLRPVSKRQNLHVSLHSHVEKIMINSFTNQAYGVQFQKYGVTKQAYIRREVILSAGAIKTPQLLMLSGVGPADHLERMKIEVVYNSPGVGHNLQDHVSMGGIVHLFDVPDRHAGNPSAYGFLLPEIFSIENMERFVKDRDGPIYWLPECEVMGFVRTKYSNPAEDRPDVQLFFASYADNTDGGLFSKKIIGYTDELYRKVFQPVLYKHAYNIMPLLLRPRSRGRILLKDGNPGSDPLIYPNYFADPWDLDVLVEGAKIAIAVGNTSIMKLYNSTIHKLPIPGCQHLTFFTDDYLRCQAKHYTLTIYHPVGTAKMGKFGDPLAVLDYRLRVRGIANLRVVDASVMPTIVSGNTNAPVIMIAEKAADMVKSDWDLSNIEGLAERVASQGEVDEKDALRMREVPNYLETLIY